MIGIAPPVIVMWARPMWFAAEREQLANGDAGTAWHPGSSDWSIQLDAALDLMTKYLGGQLWSRNTSRARAHRHAARGRRDEDGPSQLAVLQGHHHPARLCHEAWR